MFSLHLKRSPLSDHFRSTFNFELRSLGKKMKGNGDCSAKPVNEDIRRPSLDELKSLWSNRGRETYAHACGNTHSVIACCATRGRVYSPVMLITIRPRVYRSYMTDNASVSHA